MTRFFPIFSWSTPFFNACSSFKKNFRDRWSSAYGSKFLHLYQRRTGSKSVGYNFFNWTTRNMNQKFRYFPRPSIRVKPIHSRRLYFPPVSTSVCPNTNFRIRWKCKCILNLATYFIFPLHRPFFYYSLCKLTCKFILFKVCRHVSEDLSVVVLSFLSYFFLRSADYVGRPFCFCSVSYYFFYSFFFFFTAICVSRFLPYFSTNLDEIWHVDSTWWDEEMLEISSQ